MLERDLADGRINDAQFRANLKIVFCEAHENVQQFLNSVFWELGHNQEVQNRLWQVFPTRAVEPFIELISSMTYLSTTI